jgi:hypothetical protein
MKPRSHPVHCATATAAETNSLAKLLEPLRHFLGKTWQDTSNLNSRKADHRRFSLGARPEWACQSAFSTPSTRHGGETIIMRNRKNERLEFDYFTTAGFMTHGTIRMEDGKMLTHETVVGSEEGVTEVEAVAELLPNGKFHSKSRYLKKGEWVDGHEVTYEEAPEAVVVFK